MPSPYGPLTVIVNPHAGKRRVGEEIPELERTLRARDLPYTLRRTEGRGDAGRFAREALEGGSRFIVAVGGDGTVHEVVNGMIGPGGSPAAPDAVLGVVAAGSGSDFIRTFGLPGDASRACYHLTGDNTYPLDVGAITYTTVAGDTDTRYFVNVAEAGLGAAVAARAERMSRRFGQTKYFFSFWRTLPGFRLATVRVQADRRVYEGPAFLVVVGNGQYYGGGMKISPRSYPGDGVLDVLIFRARRRTPSRCCRGSTGASTSRTTTSRSSASGARSRSRRTDPCRSRPTARSSAPPGRRSTSSLRRCG
jgi:YegS/Rv2252/BmrU family lipid kinase